MQDINRHSFKYNEIKEYFEVSSRYNSKINDPLDNLKDCDVIIGVAIRHGDYKTWQNGKFFIATEIYQKWMEKEQTLFEYTICVMFKL